MKLKNSILLMAAAASAFGLVATSCSDDLPGENGGGYLKMRMVLNSDVTRANVDDQSLSDACMIYISNSKGLIHKFQGVGNVPSDLWLRSGSYVAEAWTGDSVSASFDKKFYKAYQPFVIEQGVTNVVLNCKIANVVASVNRDRISTDMLPQFTVTVGHTRGQLEFNADNINTEKGYFMMPNGDDKLVYTIEGVNIMGTKFTKTGEIPAVKRAHEYVLTLNYNEQADQNDVGGAFITISVDDREILIEDDITLLAGPQIEGIGSDISAPLAGPAGSFGDIFLGASCFGSFRNFNVTFSDASAFGVPSAEYDLSNIAPASETALRESGFSWSVSTDRPGQTHMRLKLPAGMLNRLTNGAYSVTFSATDSNGYTTVRKVNIEVSDAAVLMLPVEQNTVRSYSAKASINIVKDVTNPGIRFRKAGDSEWITSSTAQQNTGTVTFKLTGLQPATTYEVQAVADGYVNTKSERFTTEGIFTIPNAGFEDWSTYKNGSRDIPFPGTGSSVTFWDSGNQGSMTMSKAITTQASSPVHSGSSSIKLESQFVGIGIAGKFAAGNVFAGSYVRTDGTDGVLSWGRPMTHCHPVKFSGWANYRPKAVTHSKTDLLPEGQMDKGTVYAAVVTGPVEIRTKASNRALFDKDADYVLAFGQVIWDGDFGPDGQLAHFEIPLTWKNPDYTGQMYIVIVASASLYGDYFTGGPSIMYLDDLELSYE